MFAKLNKMMSLALDSSAASSNRNHRKPRGFKPGFEALEDRRVPATIAVTTFADVVNAADGKVSLREAITQANATPALDAIRLQAGLYALSIAGQNENGNATGDFDITNPLTIVGSSSGPTVIDGEDLDRVFDVLGTYTATFSQVAIRDGTGLDVHGGGIQALTANLVLNNSTVSGNRGVKGGGINAENGDVTLRNSRVIGNFAWLPVDSDGHVAAGGGIHAGHGTVTLLNSTISKNDADGDGGNVFADTVTLTNSTVSAGGGANGAGIFAFGDVTLTHSTVANNVAADDYGGGIFVKNGNVTLTDSRVTGNTAVGALGAGAGIYSDTGNVTLLRSTLNHNRATANGGGLYVEDGLLTLRDSTVRRNVAGYPGNSGDGGFGGGVWAENATLFNSTVGLNTAFTSGGGIYAFESVTLNGSTVSRNSARGDGGGIFTTDRVSLTNSTVSGNGSGTSGGGIAAGMAFVTSSTVSGNHTRGFGGGISAVTATLTTSTVSDNSASTNGGGMLALDTATLERSTVSGNTAGASGGGIKAITVDLTNSTISGNSAGLETGLADSVIGGGGGIFARSGRLLNSTVVENFAVGNGGGVLWTGKTERIRVKNTIIADNLVLAFSSGPDVSGIFVSEGHNLIGQVNGSSGFGAAGDQLGGTYASLLDPKLGPLASNGGPTQTHALLPGSPAIDTGNNTGAPATDQRGLARIKDGNADGSLIVDIGAFER